MKNALENGKNMCYNISIMKKYCFFIILTAAFLCGCEGNNGVAEYVYEDYSPLTIVTTVTEVPADTYSEYMETYTPATTTGTDVYYYHVSPEWEHGMAIAQRPEMPEIFSDGNYMADTAMTMAPAPKAEKPITETASVTTAVPADEQTDETITTDTAVSEQVFELPAPDTAHVNSAVPDTAPTRFAPSETTAETTTE